MKKFLRSYRASLILLGSIILGGVVGAVWGPQASILKPFGDLFLNLLFMVLVPLVFFSVASAIASMSGVKRLGKIMGNILIVFSSTAIVAALIGVLGTFVIDPIQDVDISAFESLTEEAEVTEDVKDLNYLEQLVNTVTVSDFSNLLSRSNMLQLIVFSVLFGLGTTLIGDKGKPFAAVLESGAAIMMKIVSLIMYYAPIGLGCYFASVIGDLGTQILGGYLRVFVLYLILTIIYYFGFNTLYAYFAGGKKGIKVFWKHAVAPSVTALATCSSAASIPVNLEYTKKMGVPDDIAETVIPLGANTHKDGSVLGGVMKVTFLLALFGKDMTSPSALLGIIVVSFLVGAVMGAIPGGGMIGELLILSIYGFPPEMLPIIAVISTIIDAPATLLNSTGNTVCAMMVTRLVEGKNWLEGKIKTA